MAKPVLTFADAADAAALYLSGKWSMAKLAERFGCTITAITNAWDRHAANLPTDELDIMKRWWFKTSGQAKLTPGKVRQIRQWRAEGRSNQWCALKVGVHRAQVSRVSNGHAWGWVR